MCQALCSALVNNRYGLCTDGPSIQVGQSFLPPTPCSGYTLHLENPPHCTPLSPHRPVLQAILSFWSSYSDGILCKPALPAAARPLCPLPGSCRPSPPLQPSVSLRTRLQASLGFVSWCSAESLVYCRDFGKGCLHRTCPGRELSVLLCYVKLPHEEFKWVACPHEGDGHSGFCSALDGGAHSLLVTLEARAPACR